MNKSNYLHYILTIILLLTFFVQASAQKILKTIPENLHGFWQFQVDNRGDWNGLHVGSNYVEHFYSLSQVDSVVQNGNKYIAHLTYSDRRNRLISFELLSANEALIQLEGEDTPKRSKLFEADPNIQILPVSQYKKVVDGTWIVGNDVRKPLSINKNKLSWNGDIWNIHWLGEYLKKEYRALVEKDKQYRLIYITRLANDSLKLVFNQGTEYFRPIPNAVNQNMLYGTWCDPITNEWIIGFFDNIAVYQNQAWKYEIVDREKNNYIVEIQKNGEKRLLNLQLKNKNLSQLELKEGDVKQMLVYTARPKPYNYPDSKQFVDNGYHTDTVTISGYLQNVPNKQQPFEIIVPNFLTTKQDEYFADIDENGLFTVKFPVLNTSQIAIDWGRSYMTDVVEPGESYFLYINYTGVQNLWNHSNAVVWQMGKNARLHREITAHQLATKIEIYPYYSDFKGTSDDYLATCNNICQRKLNALDRYIAKNPIQSERFKTFKYSDELFDFGYYLMQRRFSLDLGEKERFSANYMKMADSVFNQLPILFTLNNKIGYFLSDYVAYYNNLLNNTGIITFHQTIALKYFDRLGVFPLTDIQREAIDKFSEALDIGFSLQSKGKDSTYIAERMNTYDRYIKIYNEIFQDSAFALRFNEEWKKVEKEVMLNRGLEAIDTLKMSDTLRDLLVLRHAYKTYDWQRKPFEKMELDLLNKRIKEQHFKDLLQQKQNDYIALQGQSIRYIESLKRTDHLKDAKDADELLKKLTEPYLGKIIHIDFWGTWCGPCRTQMEYAGKVKDALKDKDVIFMYFANRSPEDSWKNVIKQFDLTGENVVHYNLPEEQQSMLERRLGVNSFPTYMIMDKTGKIVDMNPPMPMQTDQLIDELNKWVEK